MDKKFSFGALVNGQVGVHDAETELAVTTPSTGLEIGRLPAATHQTIDRAVGAARAAHDSGVWRRMPERERGLRMRRLAQLIESNAAELARLEALDTGKAVSYTRANDLQVAVDALDFFSTQFRSFAGAASMLLAPAHIQHEIVRPVGVVAEILPWNGPIWTGVQRLACVLASGSTTVIKPSELGSLSFARLAELVMEADIPAGVVNIIFGRGDVGAGLVSHPGVDAVSFTGGTLTGGRILEVLSTNIKPVTLELGGKNSLIVLGDADVEEAAAWAAIGGFGNAGQICVSSSRVIVAEQLEHQFVEALTRHASEIVVGDPLDPDVQMGSLISRDHAVAVREAIDHGREVGAVIVADAPAANDGAFVAPTVITGVPESDLLVNRELFGPIVTVQSFRSNADAVHMANRTSYGLAAGVFTNDVRLAWEVSAALNAGEVYVNRWFSPGVLEAPVAGQKASGLGNSGLGAYLKKTTVFFERGEDLSLSDSPN